MDFEKAEQIAARKPWPHSWEEELERAREIIAACGDLPEALAHAMCMRAPAGIDAVAAIDALRGPDAPAYPESDFPRV